MEPVTVKFEDNFIKDIEKAMSRHRYATKAEFIREAIREKIKELEKEEALARVRKLYGASKRRTTDEELHKAGEEAVKEIEKELGF
jgi:Arc/MetJ-type ribon-helix-helix transcriptional regulator